MKKPAKATKTSPHPNLQLKRAREQQGWSQEHVGQQIGTDAFTVSRWERGITTPSPHFRQKLTSLFSLSVIELGLVPPETDERATVPPITVESPQPTQLTQTAPILDPAIPSLPANEHGLVGRDELLRMLKQRLLSGKRVALSALNGLPGVGKTALATAIAHDDEIRAHFSDGILWVGLGYEPDILGQFSRWGTLLNCAPADLAQRSRPEAWATSIHAAIGQRRMLLVIDDAWDTTQALAFQVGGPNCAHLITTRFPEIARRFAADGAITVRELEETDGRLLLMRLAPEVVQAEPEGALALVAAAGGLPLALTLLGNFLRAQSHSGQPRRLRAALERLRSAEERLRLTEPQALISSHPSLSSGTPLSLQAIIGISDQQVSEEARTTLRALAVFPPKPNTFSEDATIAVSAMPVETLDELTDAGLLESSGPERYTLHQTIADYARAQLSDTEVIKRLVSYYVTYVEAHTLDYRALEAESNNILAALDAAFEQQLLPDLVRGVHAFAPSLMARGLWTIVETMLQRSLIAAQSLKDANGQAIALLHLGKIAEHRGNYPQAITCWQEALLLARENDYQPGIAHVLQELGTLAWQQGKPQEAHEFLTEALAMLRLLGNQSQVASTLRILGHLAADQGQPEQARLLYQQAHVIFREAGDRRGVALTMHNLGIIEREQGNPEQAHLLYQEALTTLRELGDQISSATVLINLGHLARQQGQPEQAYRYLNEALAIHRQMGNPRRYAFTLLNIGNLLVDQGQLEQAQVLLDEALSIFRDLQDKRDIALTLQTLGVLFGEKHEFEQAHRLLNESLAIFQNLHDVRWIALTIREQGILARLQRQPEQARSLLETALNDFLHLGDLQEVASTRIELGILTRQQGQVEEARQLLTEALTTLRQSKNRPVAARALKELGIISYQQGQLQEALPLLLTAAIGLTLVASPSVRETEQLLQQLSHQSGTNAFTALINYTIQSPPEPAYALDSTAWEDAIQKLAKKVLGE